MKGQITKCVAELLLAEPLPPAGESKLLTLGVPAGQGAAEQVPKTVVGAVNWDCSLPSETWFGHYSTTSLSPAKYRRVTPFYADVKAPDRIDYHLRSVAEFSRDVSGPFSFRQIGQIHPPSSNSFQAKARMCPVGQDFRFSLIQSAIRRAPVSSSASVAGRA